MSETLPLDPLANMMRSAAAADESGSAAVNRALKAVRSHLGMKVAYVSEFVDNRSVFRHVDAPGCDALIKVGDSYSLDDVYCRKILDGKIPELMPDTAAVPEAAMMPITSAVPVGAHMSVPIRLPDGSVYGMFCCLSFEPDRSLNGRDLQMMKVFADLTAFDINRDLEDGRVQDEKHARIQAVLERSQLAPVYQPIFSLGSNRPTGFECLTRFSAEPKRTPDLWFQEAAEAGLGLELEVAAARLALSALPALPPDVYLSVNASPQVIMCAAFTEMLAKWQSSRVVLEVTEHASVDDYADLMTALQPLRERGIRLAVDDAGAGYSSLRHILDLQPDMIKLDIALTRNIHLDPARRAMASALIQFALETHSEIVAEGIETAGELTTVRRLGVDKAQGYYLGRPLPLEKTLAMFTGTGEARRGVA
jgi:EAL domain-containing protein (putative c-di-GMP-specific phosphodiesterase class I)